MPNIRSIDIAIIPCGVEVDIFTYNYFMELILL